MAWLFIITSHRDSNATFALGLLTVFRHQTYSAFLHSLLIFFVFRTSQANLSSKPLNPTYTHASQNTMSSKSARFSPNSTEADFGMQQAAEQEKRMTQTALPLSPSNNTSLFAFFFVFVLTDYSRGGYSSSQGQGFVQDSFGNDGTAPKV